MKTCKSPRKVLVAACELAKLTLPQQIQPQRLHPPSIVRLLGPARTSEKSYLGLRPCWKIARVGGRPSASAATHSGGRFNLWSSPAVFNGCSTACGRGQPPGTDSRPPPAGGVGQHDVRIPPGQPAFRETPEANRPSEPPENREKPGQSAPPGGAQTPAEAVFGRGQCLAYHCGGPGHHRQWRRSAS